jgi:hypothetical protein
VVCRSGVTDEWSGAGASGVEAGEGLWLSPWLSRYWFVPTSNGLGELVREPVEASGEVAVGAAVGVAVGVVLSGLSVRVAVGVCVVEAAGEPPPSEALRVLDVPLDEGDEPVDVPPESEEDGEPLDGEPLDGEPLDGEPLDGEPLDDESLDGELLDGELPDVEPELSDEDVLDGVADELPPPSAWLPLPLSPPVAAWRAW